MGFEQTGALIAKSIQAYNQIRPHSSCDYLTPEQAHLREGKLRKRWRTRPVKIREKEPCIAEVELTTCSV